MTERVLGVLKRLQYTPYLPTHYISALEPVYKDLFTDLKDAGMIESIFTALDRHDIHYLTRKATEYLKSQGLHDGTQRTSGSLHHRIAECMVASLFEIGAKEAGYRLIRAPEILSKAPQKTREAHKPYEIPVTITYERGGVVDRVDSILHPDWEPFGFEKDGKFLFTIGFEFDKNTEPLAPADFTRKSIRKNLYQYVELTKRGIYKTHYNIPNLIIPIIALSDTRIDSMMRELNDITDGEGASNIIFKSMSDFTRGYPVEKPTPAFMLEPWKRVGHPPFNFKEVLDGWV